MEGYSSGTINTIATTDKVMDESYKMTKKFQGSVWSNFKHFPGDHTFTGQAVEKLTFHTTARPGLRGASPAEAEQEAEMAGVKLRTLTPSPKSRQRP